MAERRPGRPLKACAKRRDPNMEQTTVYMRTKTKNAVRIRLMDSPMDLSDLVNLLLAQWVQQQEAMGPKKGRVVSLFPEPE